MAERNEEQNPPDPQCLAPDAVAPKEVEAQLARLLATESFQRSPQLARFLKYLVLDELENSGKGTKEYEIGRRVFNKPESFDVRLDPIVRVEARRLRTRLAEYYGGEGSADPVLVDLSARGYRPSFSIRPAATGPARPPDSLQPPAPAFTEQEMAIAVLPFVDMTEDGDQEYFCDGLTEELIHALTRVQGLQVASRSSSFQFKGSGQDVRKVGATLGVAVVMEGSVRRQDKRLRVTTQLTSAATGFHLWSKTYDAELEDLFTVQESIAEAIVTTLREARQAAVSPMLLRKQTDQPATYRAFLKGLQLQRSSLEADLLSSEAKLVEATEADTNYVNAFAALARTRVKLVWQEYRLPSEGWPLAKSAAEGALQLDPACTLALAVTGSTRSLADWNWQQAAKSFEEALRLSQGDAFVHQAWAMHHLAPLGRLDEALRAMTLATELSHGSFDSACDLGWIHYLRGELTDASEQFQAALAEKPDEPQAILGMARCHLAKSDPNSADAALQGASEADRNRPAFLALQAWSAVQSGRDGDAQAIAKRLDTMPERALALIAAAQTAVALNRLDRASDYLREAVESRCPRVVEVAVDPLYKRMNRSGHLDPILILTCLREAV